MSEHVSNGQATIVPPPTNNKSIDSLSRDQLTDKYNRLVHVYAKSSQCVDLLRQAYSEESAKRSDVESKLNALQPCADTDSIGVLRRQVDEWRRESERWKLEAELQRRRVEKLSDNGRLESSTLLSGNNSFTPATADCTRQSDAVDDNDTTTDRQNHLMQKLDEITESLQAADAKALYYNTQYRVALRQTDIAHDELLAKQEALDAATQNLEHLKRQLESTSSDYESTIQSYADHISSLNETITAQGDQLSALRYEMQRNRGARK